MGGALLQQHNRDTQKFAMKCSYMEANGRGIRVFKQPITDPGKNSKAGKLDVIRLTNGKLATTTIPVDPDGKPVWNALPNSEMVTVFEDGYITKAYTLEEVRKNASIEPVKHVVVPTVK